MNNRSFEVIDVRKHGGCKTKFKSGRYISRTPLQAAKKAFTKLCRVKKTYGKCTFIVTLRETTQGSKKKTFAYKVSRNKLKNPVVRLAGTPNEFLIKYEVVAKSAEGPLPKCTSTKGQTRGRMRGGTLKNVIKKVIKKYRKKEPINKIKTVGRKRQRQDSRIQFNSGEHFEQQNLW